MTDIPFADEIHAFLEDEENVEALTDAVQELHRIFRDGTSDRPPLGILSTATIQTMTQEAHSQIHGLHSQHNPDPFCYSRPDILDAHICAMRAACQIGVDLSEDRDFTPTED